MNFPDAENACGLDNIVSSKPGSRLFKAREALKLSREEVARQLRISLHIVDALEADNYDCIAAPVYIKGYLRAYAKLLQLSSAASNALLEDYNKSQMVRVGEDADVSAMTFNDIQVSKYSKFRRIGYAIILTVLTITIIFFVIRRISGGTQIIHSNMHAQVDGGTNSSLVHT